MTPSDFFGYQISDSGRLVLPGLTPEETLEYEMLSRQEREQRDRLTEMRQLELYLKQHKATRSSISTAKNNPDSPRATIYPSSQIWFERRAAAPRRAERLDPRSMVAIIGVCLGA